MDACDEEGVVEVGVKGPARGAKTVAAENVALKRWSTRPTRVLWYMQSAEDMEDYMEERGEWMIENHPRVSERLVRDRRNSLTRKRIGGELALFRPATQKSTRGKSAPLIIADEIDGYSRKIRASMLTLVRNRRREFGSAALAYFCSHPDAGPTEGIDAILDEAIVHLWWLPCESCEEWSSPAAEASHRMNWNISALLEQNASMDNTEIVALLKLETRLVCPHCQHEHDDDARLRQSGKGVWLQQHQRITGHNGEIHGERLTGPTMGFVIHGFMSPFVDIGELAGEFAIAKRKADQTGNADALKEVTVKSLGETFEGGKAEERMEDWQTVRARLQAPYAIKTIPRGVDFLTAFVDIQGDRFEVRVIGWSRNVESWLIDSFSLKQWPNGENVDPANNLRDWDLIEERVLHQSWPLATNRGDENDLFMSVAKVAVDLGGGGGSDGLSTVTSNARLWKARLLTPRPGRQPVEDWRVQLQRGSASKKQQEIYGVPRQVAKDEHGKALPTPVYERTVNVHAIKKIIARRMKLSEPGAPGRMHMPSNVGIGLYRELTAEKLVNDEWIARGRNETWDGWVACEAARHALRPDRPEINWEKPPIWARALPRSGAPGIATENAAATPKTYFDRLAEVNSDVTGNFGYEQ